MGGTMARHSRETSMRAAGKLCCAGRWRLVGERREGQNLSSVSGECDAEASAPSGDERAGFPSALGAGWRWF